MAGPQTSKQCHEHCWYTHSNTRAEVLSQDTNNWKIRTTDPWQVNNKGKWQLPLNLWLWWLDYTLQRASSLVIQHVVCQEEESWLKSKSIKVLLSERHSKLSRGAHGDSSRSQPYLSWLGLMLGVGTAEPGKERPCTSTCMKKCLTPWVRTWACHKGSRNLLPLFPGKTATHSYRSPEVIYKTFLPKKPQGHRRRLGRRGDLFILSFWQFGLWQELLSLLFLLLLCHKEKSGLEERKKIR